MTSACVPACKHEREALAMPVSNWSGLAASSLHLPLLAGCRAVETIRPASKPLRALCFNAPRVFKTRARHGAVAPDVALLGVVRLGCRRAAA
eukprot:537143-Pleurochrysis_carterae.AAC.1